jgi:ATP-dependent protease ClpP protease subunit
MHEVLLYGFIYSQSAVDFIKAINDVEGDELTIRVNTEGGEYLYANGMIAKFKEFEGKKKVVVDGSAYSMGAFFLLYADEVEAADFSRILFHRASYGEYYEQNLMTESQKVELTAYNKNLEAAFRNKIDVAKFEEITNVKVKAIFSMDGRIDVGLSAAEAKKIGLITKVNKLTPEKKAKIKAEMAKVEASFPGIKNAAAKEAVENTNKQTNKNQNNLNENKMTLEEFKKANPEAYAAIVAIGVESGIKQGIKAENDRVGAWAAYSEIDPEAVKAGIKSGEKISETARSEFAIKMQSPERLAALKKESEKTPGAEGANENPPAGDEKPTVEATFEKEVAKAAGLPTEKVTPKA